MIHPTGKPCTNNFRVQAQAVRKKQISLDVCQHFGESFTDQVNILIRIKALQKVLSEPIKGVAGGPVRK